jgi:hypothetical protein
MRLVNLTLDSYMKHSLGFWNYAGNYLAEHRRMMKAAEKIALAKNTEYSLP